MTVGSVGFARHEYNIWHINRFRYEDLYGRRIRGIVLNAGPFCLWVEIAR